MIINLDNQIKIYSSSGSLIAQSAFYSLDPGDAIVGIEYSFYYDRIFALLISGKLLVINPSTLSLEQTVGLTQSSDQCTDLAVTSDGVIYIVTWPGMAYKVSGGNKVFFGEFQAERGKKVTSLYSFSTLSAEPPGFDSSG